MSACYTYAKTLRKIHKNVGLHWTCNFLVMETFRLLQLLINLWKIFLH